MTAFPPALLSRVAPGALVVSGSRSFEYHDMHWAKERSAYVAFLAQQRGWAIVVGDALGVDTYVIQRACLLKIPLVVLGCETVGHIRAMLTTAQRAHALTWLVPGGTHKTCFAIRDAALAELAATAEKRGFYGVWDGASRGTQLTFEKCKALGIPGVLQSGAQTERWTGGAA